MGEEPWGADLSGESEEPKRLPRIWIAAAVLTALAALGVVVWSLVPRTTVCSILEEPGALRQTVGLIEAADAPLAPDGRLDVYAVLRREGREECLALSPSERAGKWPTWEEIEAGDHANFPYQRHRGAFDRDAKPPVPVLWDRQPRKLAGGDGTGRVVAFSDGSVRFLMGAEEATMQEFFREHPGQE